MEKIAGDRTGPVIKMESDDIEISISDSTEALLKGVTAVDAGDGDVTDSLCVESVGPISTEGKRIVRYIASDSDGHVARAMRTLSYTDYTDPVFEISQPLTYAATEEHESPSSLLGGVIAQDCIDGDITDSIELLFDDSVVSSVPGLYSARLRVINSAGGFAEIPVTVEFYESVKYEKQPLLKLTDYLVYTGKGEMFSAADYLKSAVISGTEYSFVNEGETFGGGNTEENTIDRNRVTVTGSVDTNTAGCYEIAYSLEDTVFGTGIGTTRLLVVVTEGGAE